MTSHLTEQMSIIPLNNNPNNTIVNSLIYFVYRFIFAGLSSGKISVLITHFWRQ